MPRHRRPRAHGEPSCHAGTHAVGRGRVGGLRHVRHGRGIARDRQRCRGRVDEAGQRFARGARRGRPSRAGGRSFAQPAPPGGRSPRAPDLAAPSLFTHYARPPRLDGQSVIGISQSGESPDVVAVIEEARRQGSLTIAITNVAESRLARAAELVLPLEAGEEASVPASKTYTASLVALALISQALDPDALFESALQRVPQAIARALETENDIEALVPPLLGRRAIVLGRGFNFSAPEDVALKLSETSYVLARAWSVADFEHGPIAIVEAGLPGVVLDGGGPVGSDLQSVRSQGAA